MRRLLSLLNLIVSTLFLATVAVFVSPIDRDGGRIHRIARFWASIHLRVSGITVSLQNAENLPEPPYLFMSNHQSSLDIFALLAALPLSFKFIAKRQLFVIPFFGWAMRRAGYISIDRDSPREALKAIEEAVEKIREGTTVLIFPEGTRSPDGKLLPFMKGAFFLASRAAVPVVPLAIVGTNQLQPPGKAVPGRKGQVTVHVGRPILPGGKDLPSKAGLMEEVRRAIEGMM